MYKKERTKKKNPPQNSTVTQHSCQPPANQEQPVTDLLTRQENREETRSIKRLFSTGFSWLACCHVHTAAQSSDAAPRPSEDEPGDLPALRLSTKRASGTPLHLLPPPIQWSGFNQFFKGQRFSENPHSSSSGTQPDSPALHHCQQGAPKNAAAYILDIIYNHISKCSVQMSYVTLLTFDIMHIIKMTMKELIWKLITLFMLPKNQQLMPTF